MVQQVLARNTTTEKLLTGSAGEEIWNTLLYGIINAARGTVEAPFQDFNIILFGDTELEVSLADRAAEYWKKGAFHTWSLISMILATSGPVEMSVIGHPMSCSAFSRKSRAFLVSLS
ncbi:MAG: hypothetical protein A4E42_01933 [Methanoregulaceae archaeon PtaU1.Bin222]|nr:MAG: hypothetical protein A4E42_01933 [Methanoregulaceae archaeon PtaU1.Bin222]